ncbi:MAG: hypothetical protein ACI4J6_10120 [Oscillospiraceae bacterium]
MANTKLNKVTIVTLESDRSKAWCLARELDDEWLGYSCLPCL